MNRPILVFFSSAFLALLAVNSTPAFATGFSREVSALYCAAYNSDDQWGSYAISNFSTTATKYYACPIPNDAQRALTQVSTDTDAIKVLGSAISARGVQAWACLSYYATAGGACGEIADNGSTLGAFSVSPSRSAWAGASAYDTPYIGVTIQHCQASGSFCTGYNLVRGIHVKYADL